VESGKKEVRKVHELFLKEYWGTNDIGNKGQQTERRE
jgi:hypothetical protein